MWAPEPLRGATPRNSAPPSFTASRGPTFFLHFSKELLGSLCLRQNAAPDCLLERNRSKICTHSSRLRRALPSACLRIRHLPVKQFYPIETINKTTPQMTGYFLQSCWAIDTVPWMEFTTTSYSGEARES